MSLELSLERLVARFDGWAVTINEKISELIAVKNDLPSALNLSFYVDAEVGDDTNPGTEMAPFQTIGQALSKCRSGCNNNIRLTDGQTFDLAANPKSVYLRAGTIVQLRRNNGDLITPENRPVIVHSLWDDPDDGQAKAHTQIFVNGFFALTMIGVEMRFPAAPSGVAPTGTWGALVRPNHFVSGAHIGLHASHTHFVLEEEGGYLSGPLLRSAVLLGLSASVFSGQGSLLHHDDGMLHVTGGNVTADAGVTLCDGGTLGADVFTTLPAITL